MSFTEKTNADSDFNASSTDDGDVDVGPEAQSESFTDVVVKGT